jgi:hypothetical protein
MRKPRTHFEQVPLEIVKKIAEVEIPPETVTPERHRGISKKKAVEELRVTQKQSRVNSSRFSRAEVSKS